MNCTKTRRQLDMYMDSELSVPENMEVLEHLNLCRTCQDVFQIEEKLRSGLAALQGSGRKWDREFESGLLQQRVCLSSETAGLYPKNPAVSRRSARARGREKRRAGRNSAPLCPFSLTGIDAVPPRTTGQAAVNRGLQKMSGFAVSSRAACAARSSQAADRVRSDASQ